MKTSFVSLLLAGVLGAGVMTPSPTEAASLVVSIGDRGYYHGRSYRRHHRHYVWVPGYWHRTRHHHRVWIHGHYAVR